MASLIFFLKMLLHIFTIKITRFIFFMRSFFFSCVCLFDRCTPNKMSVEYSFYLYIELAQNKSFQEFPKFRYNWTFGKKKVKCLDHLSALSTDCQAKTWHEYLFGQSHKCETQLYPTPSLSLA